MGNRRNAKKNKLPTTVSQDELFTLSQDDPGSYDEPPPISYKDVITSPIFSGAKFVHTDPNIVPPVRNQGDLGTCIHFAGCDACSCAYLLHMKNTSNEVTPVLLAPQGPIDFGPQNERPKNKKRLVFHVPTDWEFFEYAQTIGLFLDRDLPYQLKRVVRDSKSLSPSFRRLKYNVRELNEKSIDIPDNKKDDKVKTKILKLIKRQPCFAHLPLSKKFEDHRGTDIFRYYSRKKKHRTHAVLVLGYDYDENKKLYAIIKNSGYLTFGYYGYARVDFSLLTDFWAPRGEYFEWV